MRNELEESYGYLFEKELIDEIVEVGTMHEASRGETIIEHGQNLRSMPLILEGAVKISRKPELATKRKSGRLKKCPPTTTIAIDAVITSP